MRVIFLNRSLKEYTGAGRFALALIRELKNLTPGLECAVLTTEPSGHPLDAPIIYGNKFKLFAAIPAIRKVFKRYDVIHALDAWPYGVVAVFASLGLRKKVIITAIGSGAIRPLYNFWRRPIMKWAYRKADKVVAVSNNTKKEILKFLPGLDITVINHGVSLANFQFPLNDKFQNLKPYILSTGFLKERKGFEYSIRAFAEIAGQYPKITYAIFGTDNYPDNREYKRLKKVAENLGVGDRVKFLSYDEQWFGGRGRISDEDLAALYKSAELFILLPQDFNKDIEGFGLVFLEAAAAGLPVIATKGTSAEDAVRDGKNGLLVSVGDYKKAAEVITKILSDQSLKKSFSEESIKFAREMSWEKVARAYKKIYDEHNDI